MSAVSKWLEQLTRELDRNGIDPCEQRRLIAELRDHWEDCQLEYANPSSQRSANMATDQVNHRLVDQINARIGNAHEVARAARDHGPRRSFAQRHPLLVCLVTPMPLMLLLAAAYAAFVITVLAIWKPQPTSNTAPIVLSALFFGFLYVPSILAASMLTWVAVRNGIKARWLVLGMIPLALLASHITLTYRLPDRPGNGNLSLGADLSPSLGSLPQLIVPCVAAAAIGLWLRLQHVPAPLGEER